MRVTPGLLGGAGLATGVMYLVRRLREKRRRALPVAPMRATTTIEAPIERVFDAWSRFEEFPRFMPMVTEVRPTGSERWQWTVADAFGASMQVVTRVTQRDRPHLIAWTAEGDAVAEHSGTVRFQPTAGSGTRMDLELSRRASGDDVGETERALREGLTAFKTHVESAAHHAA
jgi:uncharacterized membrane protein